MRRVVLVAGVFLLAGCGSSAAKAPAPTTATTTTQAPASSTAPTTHPAPPTTARPSPAASDQLAQFKLTAAINAAQTIYHQHYDYTAVSPASLAALLPNLHFADLGHATTSVVGVMAQDRNDVLLVLGSASGRWYCVTENAMDGISYGEGKAPDAVDSNGECQRDSWPAPGKDQSLF
jgi:hypothetical protein